MVRKEGEELERYSGVGCCLPGMLEISVLHNIPVIVVVNIPVISAL